MIAANVQDTDPNGGTGGSPNGGREDRSADCQIFDCPILVVDDTASNRKLVGALLAEAGFRKLSFASGGREALDLIAAVGAPDLLILDIMMPGMDGFEVCRRLRAMPEMADLPILVQTALSSGEDRNRAFAAGTTDLVTKPLERTELLARVRIHLESRLLIRRLLAYRARVEAELAIARSMQEHLLPTPAQCAAVGEAAGCTLRARTVISPDLGGDLWGLLPLGGRRFGVYLLTVAGQGVSASLNAFRLHTLLQELGPIHGEDAAALLTVLNDRAADMMAPGEKATMTYGVVDGEAGRFTHASAEGTPPMILRNDILQGSGVPEFGTATGLPIGVAPGTRYRAEAMDLPPGAVLALGAVAAPEAPEASGGGDHALLWIERKAPT